MTNPQVLEMLNLKVTRETRRRLRVLAAQRNVSMSALVRGLIDRELRKIEQRTEART